MPKLTLALAACLVTSSALAQTAAQPSAPPAAPAAAAPPAPAVPLAPAADYDSVRVRGGFNLGGGFAFGSAVGPVVDLSLRLGVQLGRVVGITFQTQPNLFLIAGTNGVAAGFGINNSLLGELTLLDLIQLGLGPSLDYLAAAACTVGDQNCAAAEGVGFGVHARAALVLGSRNPQGGRRAGFSISVNLHPLFLGNGAFIFFSTLGIGADWY